MKNIFEEIANEIEDIYIKSVNNLGWLALN